MQGNNARFRLNPEGFLSNNSVSCYPVQSGALNTALQSSGCSGRNECSTTLEFDFVPSGTGSIINLVILGIGGTYATLPHNAFWNVGGMVKRFGSPVRGRWLPYLGQTGLNLAKMGRVILNNIPNEVNYVFTVSLTGCTLVATRNANTITVYHEPTENDIIKNEIYPGEVIGRYRPKYDETHISGFAILERRGRSWYVVIQTMAMGTNIVSDCSVYKICDL